MIVMMCAVQTFVFAKPVMTSSHLVAKTKVFFVRLPSNPTTGYQWVLRSYDHRVVILKDSCYQSIPSNQLGRGGEMIFKFEKKTEAKVSTRLYFDYQRSWEKKSIKTKLVVVDF